MTTATISDASHPLHGETVSVSEDAAGEIRIVRLLRNHRGYQAGDVLHLPAAMLTSVVSQPDEAT